MNDTRHQNIKKFEEWYGLGDEGYTSRMDAEWRKSKVDDALKGATGMVDYKSEITDRYGDNRFWVHVVRTIDYNHPDRIAAGL